MLCINEDEYMTAVSAISNRFYWFEKKTSSNSILSFYPMTTFWDILIEPYNCNYSEVPLKKKTVCRNQGTVKLVTIPT